MVILHIEPKIKLNFQMNEFGDMYVNQNHLGELSIVSSLTGPTGPTGPNICGLMGYKGNIGITGPTGERGDSYTGPMGMIGDNGPCGVIGTLGPKGMMGCTGPMGEQGPKGITIYPKQHFLYAKIDKNFQYSNDSDGYTLLPWYHIANKGFQIQNSRILFPKRYGVYKIECGIQITNFSKKHCPHISDYLMLNSLQIELRFKNNCKKNTIVIPYCKKYQTNISYCDTLQHIMTIHEETDMTIYLHTNGNIIDIQDTMFLCIIEII